MISGDSLLCDCRADAWKPARLLQIYRADIERRVLTDQLTEGHALACGDVLGVKSDQIVVGWRGTPGKRSDQSVSHLDTARRQGRAVARQRSR